MTAISTLGQSLDQVERLKQLQTQLADFQYQLASGKKSRTFKGLGIDVIASKRARASFTELENYNNNITVADRRIKLMLTSISEIKEQAGNIVNAIQIQTQQGEFEMESVGDLARNLRDFLVNLMNEKDGDRYLFGGAETLSKPINDTGILDTYLQTNISDWVGTSMTTDELVSSYRDTAQLNDTIAGFSAPLANGSVKNITVRVESSTEIDYTILANNDAFRDIIAATGMIDQLDQVLDEVTLDPDDPTGTVTAPGASKQEQNENFYQVFNDLASMINNALDGLESSIFDLSQVQAQISQIQEGHVVEQNILQEQIDTVENVDINELAVKLNALQVQLEASYRVTAIARDLSLVNFI